MANQVDTEDMQLFLDQYENVLNLQSSREFEFDVSRRNAVALRRNNRIRQSFLLAFVIVLAIDYCMMSEYYQRILVVCFRYPCFE